MDAQRAVIGWRERNGVAGVITCQESGDNATDEADCGADSFRGVTGLIQDDFGDSVVEL
jgi:hypothetical protein